MGATQLTGKNIKSDSIELGVDTSGTLPINEGGTNATTESGARTNLGLGTGDSPQFTGIELGHASDTTLTRSSAGVLAVEGATVPVNSITNTHTTQQVELGHASDTTLSRSAAGVLAVESVVVPTISSTNTLTNKRVSPRTGTTTSSATPTINTDNVDFYSLTAQTADITSFTTNLSGTPTEAQKLWIAITGTASRAITWGASFENGAVTLPTTTSGTTRLDVAFIWNSVSQKWRCMASG